MKVNLVLQRTLWDPEMTWRDTKIIEVEIPMEKINPDGKGDYKVIGCCRQEVQSGQKKQERKQQHVRKNHSI